MKNYIKYSAFLRGINVGGNSLIKMTELKKVFESLGFGDVKTILASGNVVFSSDEKNKEIISNKISGCLEKILKRTITVIVWTIDDIKKLVELKPFSKMKITPDKRLLVTFLSDNKIQEVIPFKKEYDDFVLLNVMKGVICTISDKTIAGTVDLMSLIEKEFGKDVTTRTWNTVLRILK